MLNNDANYTWNGVLQFLHKHQQQQNEKENLWILEKKSFQQQIKELQARVSGLEAINADLMNRNRMLEYCLRNMKRKDKEQLMKPQQQAPRIPERRPKPNKDHLAKILHSLGIKNLLENIQKDLNKEQPGGNISLNTDKTGEKQSILQQSKPLQYKELTTLQGHQDGVRDLLFLDSQKFLLSVSEDCTLKVWNTENRENINCLGTIRQHSGPIFTIIEAEGYVLTAGMEGITRAWQFNQMDEKKDVGRKCLAAEWTNSIDQKLQPIWQLAYSSQHKILFSTSSEIAIKGFKLDTNDGLKSSYAKSFIYNENSASKQDEDIATAICLHENKLIAGYVASHSLVHFDLSTGKIANQIRFEADGQVSTNRITSHPSMIIGAFEDNMVRIFDQNRMTYSFKAHNDSVMSVSLLSNMNQFFTCGHDGFVKLWDLRKLEPVSIFKAHEKKYDEAVHCLATSTQGMAASGGADSIIKLYSV